MYLKIIAGVFIYLLCGIGTLELALLHDRHTDDWFDKWIEDGDETIIVILFPVILPLMILHYLYIGLGKLIKYIRITITLIVFAIVVLFKRDPEGKE